MVKTERRPSNHTGPSGSGSHDDLGTHPEHREAEADDLQRRFDMPSAGEGVYDTPGNTGSNAVPNDDDMRRMTGISPEQEGRMDNRAREEGARDNHASQAENTESDALNDAVQRANQPENRGQYATDAAFNEMTNRGWSTEEMQRLGAESSRGASKRKKKTAIGFIVGIIISTFVVAFQQGPNFAIQHLREQLLGKLSELQTSHSLRYRRRHISRMRDMFSQNGRRGSRVIADMQTRGWEFRFNSQGDIVGIRPPYARDFIEGNRIGAEISGYMNRRWPLRNSKWKTARMNAFYTRFGVSRRSVIARLPDSDPDAVVEMRRRLASQVVPEEPDTSLQNRTAGGDLDEDQRTAFNNRSAENADLAQNAGSARELRERIMNGEDLTEIDEIRLRELAGDSADINEYIDTLYDIAPTDSLGRRAFNTIKSFASATDIADKVCTMKNRLRAIEFAARNYRALSLLRYTMLFVGASDEIRKGELSEVDPALVAALFRQITAIDADGNSISSSPGFAYMLRGQYSRSKNDAFRSNVGVDGVLTGIPAAINNAVDVIPGVSRGQCRVLQDPRFQIGVAAVEVAVAVFTGGGSEVGVQAGRQTATQAIRAAIKTFISRKTAVEVGESLAIDLTFEGALLVLQEYMEMATTLNFTGRECCAELGDILVAGGGTGHKQRNLQAGFVPATADEYNAALDDFAAWKQEENEKKSLYARLFDYRNYDSLTFKTADKLATIPYDMSGIGRGVHNGLNAAASILTKPLSIFSGIANILSTKAGAQPSDEVRFGEYTLDGGDLDDTVMATDPAGNFLTVLPESIAGIDPGENIQFLGERGDIEPQQLNAGSGGICIGPGGSSPDPSHCYDPESLLPASDDFRGHVQNCVEEVDIITTMENASQADPKTDCLATQDITKRYKAHLAWIDMLDGIDGGLFPEEISPSSSADSQSWAVPSTGVASGQ